MGHADPYRGGVDHLSSAGVLGALGMAIVVIAVPGPSVLFLIGQTLSGGRRRGLLSVLGNTAGFGMVALLLALGLGAVVAVAPATLTVLRFVGAAVLAWIGLGYLREASGSHLGPELRAAANPSPSPSATATDRLAGASPAELPAAPRTTQVVPATRPAGFRSAVVVGATNPKGLVTFGSIVPSFLVPGPGSTIPALLVLSSIVLAVGLVLDSVWVLIAGAARGWLTRAPGRVALLNRTGGVLILALALLVALGV